MYDAYLRALIGLMGSGFLLIGLATSSMLSWAIAVQGQPIPIGFIAQGYTLSVLGIFLGAFLLFRYAYAADVFEHGLTLKFVFAARSASWSQIVWYRYIARRWKWNGKVALLTIMKVWDPTGRSRLVLFELESREFKHGWRTKNYTSELNAMIPTIDRTRR